MSRKKKVVEELIEELVDSGEEGEMVEKEEVEEVGEEVVNTEIDWKKARARIKDLDASTGWSIEDYVKRKTINKLKTRYNNKELSEELYQAIMSLE